MMTYSSSSSSSVAHSCPTLCDPRNRSTPGLPVHHQLPEFTQTYIHGVAQSWTQLKQFSSSSSMSIQSVIPSNNLILCHPLLLPPSILPSIGVFSNESVLRIRWPKYQSFSFNISPSSEYWRSHLGLNGLISLQSKGLLRVFSSTTV